MRTLFCAPPSVGLAGESGGVLAEMRLRARALAELGHEVEYLSGWERPRWHRFDLAHLFMANAESYGLGVRVAEHLPLIVSPILDRTEPDLALRGLVRLERWIPWAYTHLGRARALCQLARAVCLRSRDEERRLVRGLGVDTPSAIVHCSFDTPRTSDDPRRLWPWRDRPFVLFLGDAGNPRKNVLQLLEAVRRLDADVELLVAGPLTPGPTGRLVNERAASMGRVHLVGRLDEAEKRFALSHARAFCLPSTTEGIGLAAVEAGLVGTTVVVTRSGGTLDYFGSDAYLVDPRSAEDISQKLRQALESPRDASARLRSFDHRTAGEQLSGLYARALGDRVPLGESRPAAA